MSSAKRLLMVMSVKQMSYVELTNSFKRIYELSNLIHVGMTHVEETKEP